MVLLLILFVIGAINEKYLAKLIGILISRKVTKDIKIGLVSLGIVAYILGFGAARELIKLSYIESIVVGVIALLASLYFLHGVKDETWI